MPADRREVISRSKPWVRDISRDAVRHFAWGIGDNNPLWLDPKYAAHSRWGDVIAPPCFAYALDETTVAPGHDSHVRRYISVLWTWFDVLQLDKSISTRATLKHQTPESEDGSFEQAGCVEFFTSGGRMVAQANSRISRETQSGTQNAEDEPRYESEELQEIERSILNESRRGADIRYWQDTEVGAKLGPLLKGPLSIMDIVAWCAATQGVPANSNELSDGGLVSNTVTGPQQVSWACHLLTDWMGDDAFVHRLQMDLFDTPILGSTTQVQGIVTHRWVQDGSHLVQVALTLTDRRGEMVSSGIAQVVLVSRGHGEVTLPVAGTVDDIADVAADARSTD